MLLFFLSNSNLKFLRIINFENEFCSLLANSRDLAEIDLWGNNIGDLGARMLLEGLKERSEAKLPGVAVRVSHRTASDTFNSIAKLAGAVKKKKMKKGGKKKKKK